MNLCEIPNHFVAKTSAGSFQIKVTNRDYITIGSRNSCVHIAYKAKTNTAVLDWLGTEKGGCEISEKEIHGRDTVTMTDLCFTILKQMYPNINPIVSFIDSSTFPCQLPNGSRDAISQMIYQLLLTGKTYYQSRFNAQLKYKDANSKSAYDLFIEARENPDLFDKEYDFGNQELNDAFAPFMQSSTTWGDFFEMMYKRFGRHSCVLMHSWYKRIYGFLAKRAIHSEWVIDISNRPMIEYTITKRNHSKNVTRKSYVYNPYEFSGGYFPSLLSYRSILYNTKHTSKTLKHRDE